MRNFVVWCLVALFAVGVSNAYDSCILDAADYKIHASEEYVDEDGTAYVDLTWDGLGDEGCCPGETVLTYDWDIDYDDAVIDFDGFDQTGLPSGCTIIHNESSSGHIEFAMICFANECGGMGDIGTAQLMGKLQFTAIGSHPDSSSIAITEDAALCEVEPVCRDDGWVRINP